MQQEEWDKDLQQVPLSRIMKLNAKEWWLIVLGVLGAGVQGSIFPVFAILFGEALKVRERRGGVRDDIAYPLLGIQCCA